MAISIRLLGVIVRQLVGGWVGLLLFVGLVVGLVARHVLLWFGELFPGQHIDMVVQLKLGLQQWVPLQLVVILLYFHIWVDHCWLGFVE